MAPRVPDSPFESIESAHEYEQFLLAALNEARAHIREDLRAAEAARLDRRIQALRLVEYKLTQLAEHISASSRLLNDLRTLRRLLLRERAEDQRSP
jgi:hypothetical protein